MSKVKKTNIFSCPGIPPYAEHMEEKETSDGSDMRCMWVTAADRLSSAAP